MNLDISYLINYVIINLINKKPIIMHIKNFDITE